MRIEYRDDSHPWQEPSTKKVVCFSKLERLAFARVAKLAERARDLRGDDAMDDEIDLELARLEGSAGDASEMLELDADGSRVIVI
tara:strand:- start:7 stop:261 length:255 start_codon:yes stop_codon:yes gene_type:complete